jgi:pimeloyl-ACP methyl ester carboxylesterase
MTDSADTAIRPFTLDVPQADVDDLRDRLDRARWPNELPGDVDDGIKQSYVRSLYGYWRNQYDWRATEARINAHPQFTTEIDGQNVHFLHVRSPEPNALPLIVTHGWPGSILEFFDIVGPLSDPRAHGGDPADAFDLVIPSIPGYGLSGPTHERGWSNYRIAAAWVELMRRLGYERYGAAGNDAGSMISPEVGRLDPEGVVGVHVTQIFSFPSGDPSEFEGLTAEEMTELGTLQWFFEN